MSEQKSGCISTLAKLFGVLILVSIVVVVIMSQREPKDGQATTTPEPAETPTSTRAASNPPQAAFDIATVIDTELPKQVILKSAEEFSAPSGGHVTVPAGTRVDVVSRSGTMLRLRFVGSQKDVDYTKTTFLDDVQSARARAAEVARQQAKQARKAQQAAEQAKEVVEQARIASGISTTVGGYLASPSQELLEKAVSYAAVNDAAALQKLMATGLVIQLKGGLEVHIADTKIFKGLVKIRPRGQTIELWTVAEAIK